MNAEALKRLLDDLESKTPLRKNAARRDLGGYAPQLAANNIALQGEIEALRQRIAELEGARILNRNAVKLQRRKRDEAEAKLAQAEREREDAREKMLSALESAGLAAITGYKAGIEAAAKVMDREARFWSDLCNDSERVDREGLAKEIRSLSPASPTDTVRQAAEPECLHPWCGDKCGTETDMPLPSDRKETPNG